jgi:deoxyxylulose-5-phosphate synthase
MNKKKQSHFLDHINSPADLKKLTLGELEQLASEIRQKIIETVSRTRSPGSQSGSCGTDHCHPLCV